MFLTRRGEEQFKLTRFDSSVKNMQFFLPFTSSFHIVVVVCYFLLELCFSSFTLNGLEDWAVVDEVEKSIFAHVIAP